MAACAILDRRRPRRRPFDTPQVPRKLPPRGRLDAASLLPSRRAIGAWLVDPRRRGIPSCGGSQALHRDPPSDHADGRDRTHRRRAFFPRPRHRQPLHPPQRRLVLQQNRPGIRRDRPHPPSGLEPHRLDRPVGHAGAPGAVDLGPAVRDKRARRGRTTAYLPGSRQKADPDACGVRHRPGGRIPRFRAARHLAHGGHPGVGRRGGLHRGG